MVRLQSRSQCLDENARPVSEMDILKFKVRRLPMFRAQKWWVASKEWIHAQEWLYIATADTRQKTLVGLIKVYIHTEIGSIPQHPQISSSLEHVLRFYAFVFGGLVLTTCHPWRQSAIDQNYMFELFVGELPIAHHSARKILELGNVRINHWPPATTGLPQGSSGNLRLVPKSASP